MPFLGILVTPTQNEIQITSVYRNPTHTDQYMHWDSHHQMGAKYGVIKTLTHRVKTVLSIPELLRTELQHIRQVFTKCKYPYGQKIGWSARTFNKISQKH